MSQRPVLVVEDDADIRESLIEALEDHGYRALGATNGHDAFALLERNSQTCLILLDLMMPLMDGREFRAAQLRLPHLAGIPVVVISAQRDAASQSPELVADAYLTKPVKVSELLGVTRRYCPDPTSEQAN